MGDGGQRLYEWAMSGKDDRNRTLLEGAIAGLGALIAAIHARFRVATS